MFVGKAIGLPWSGKPERKKTRLERLARENTLA
jgi:hypothetical protein